MAETIYDPKGAAAILGLADDQLAHSATPNANGEFDVLVTDGSADEFEAPALSPTAELTQTDFEEHGKKIRRVLAKFDEGQQSKKITLSQEEQVMLNEVKKEKDPRASLQKAFKLFSRMGKNLNAYMMELGITPANSHDMQEVTNLIQKKREQARKSHVAPPQPSGPKPKQPKGLYIHHTKGGYAAQNLDKMFGVDDESSRDPYNKDNAANGHRTHIKVQAAHVLYADGAPAQLQATVTEVSETGKRSSRGRPSSDTTTVTVPVTGNNSDKTGAAAASNVMKTYNKLGVDLNNTPKGPTGF